MPRSVHITTPRSSEEELIRLLRIPKARRKQLDAMFEETRKRFAAELAALRNDSLDREEKQESASTAR